MPKEGVDADAMQMAEQGGQIVDGLESGDAVELRLQRRQALLIDLGHIHATRILVADLLLVGAARGGVRRCRCFQNLPEVQTVQLVELGKTPIRRLIRQAMDSS